MSDSRELGNIHQCGFVGTSVGFVGGIAGKPTAAKAFMMWQESILGVCAKSDPDVCLPAGFRGIHTVDDTEQQFQSTGRAVHSLKHLFLTHISLKSFKPNKRNPMSPLPIHEIGFWQL